jgi:hypothetical protein
MEKISKRSIASELSPAGLLIVLNSVLILFHNFLCETLYRLSQHRR